MKDYFYLCTKESKGHLLEILDKLGKRVNVSLLNKWKNLVNNSNYEELVRDLITEYYDKTYKAPRGTALKTIHIESGVNGDSNNNFHSRVLEEIISFGSKYIIDEHEKNVR